MENTTNEHNYYKVTYYIQDHWEKEILLINESDLSAFYKGNLDFLPGIVGDGEHLGINGAMVYTIKQVFR